jgi:hypothetical protein
MPIAAFAIKTVLLFWAVNNMKRLVMVFIAVMTSACAKEHAHQVQIAPAFQSFVDQWHKDAESTLGRDLVIDDLIIEFDGALTIQSGEQGLCSMDGNATPVIHISPTVWNIDSAFPRQMLIYHELGHCILGRGHNNTIYEMPLSNDDGTFSQYPVNQSIMNASSQIDSIYWSLDEKMILQEYFSTENIRGLQ